MKIIGIIISVLFLIGLVVFDILVIIASDYIDEIEDEFNRKNNRK